MDVSALVVITAVLFGWGLVSARFQRADLTAPVVFVVVGAVLAWTGLVDGPEAAEQRRPWWRSPSSGCSSRMLPACP